MPADVVAGCLAEGCLTLGFEFLVMLFFEGLFPRRGRARRERRAGRPPTPVPAWERLVSLVFWGVLVALTVLAIWGLAR
ncbi:MAG: hypothetical protein ACYTGX_14675 [Planctomycetota bacterium]|jgi:hypothetical protein